MKNAGCKIRTLILAAAIVAVFFGVVGVPGRMPFAAGSSKAANATAGSEDNDLPRGAGVTEQYYLMQNFFYGVDGHSASMEYSIVKIVKDPSNNRAYLVHDGQELEDARQLNYLPEGDTIYSSTDKVTGMFIFTPGGYYSGIVDTLDEEDDSRVCVNLRPVKYLGEGSYEVSVTGDVFNKERIESDLQDTDTERDFLFEAQAFAEGRSMRIFDEKVVSSTFLDTLTSLKPMTPRADKEVYVQIASDEQYNAYVMSEGQKCLKLKMVESANQERSKSGQPLLDEPVVEHIKLGPFDSSIQQKFIADVKEYMKKNGTMYGLTDVDLNIEEYFR